MAATPAPETLSSAWNLSPGASKPGGGLSEHLIASFWAVDVLGQPRKDDTTTVKAPVTEGSMEFALNWVGPFESLDSASHAGWLGLIESAVRALGMRATSGAASMQVDALGNGEWVNAVLGKAKDVPLQDFVGRTGITKLNSIQAFSGMPPVKGQITIVFRAWRDPVAEVERPFAQLMRWALPRALANDKLSNLVDQFQGRDPSVIASFLPSEAPTLVAFKYKGRTWKPMVVESIGYPLDSQVDKNGHYVSLTVPLTLCTLAAMDRADFDALAQLAPKS